MQNTLLKSTGHNKPGVIYALGHQRADNGREMVWKVQQQQQQENDTDS